MIIPWECVFFQSAPCLWMGWMGQHLNHQSDEDSATVYSGDQTILIWLLKGYQAWLVVSNIFRGVETTNQRLLIPIFAGLFRSFGRSYSQGFVSSGSVASSNLYAWWLIWVSQAACGALDEPDWQWCFCASKASEIGSVPYIFASAWYNWMI